LSRIKNKEYQGKQTVGDLVNKREELWSSYQERRVVI
jgi:hypothetical protein